MFYLTLINQNNKYLRASIILGLLIFNLNQLRTPTPYYNFTDKSEYRLVANWLNSQNFKKPVIVIIYESHILRYYTDNPQVTFDTITPDIFDKCQTKMSCIANEIYQKYTKNHEIYFVSTTNSFNSLSNQDKYAPLILGNVSSYQNIDLIGENINFPIIIILGDDYHWAKIYKYLPDPNSKPTK